LSNLFLGHCAANGQVPCLSGEGANEKRYGISRVGIPDRVSLFSEHDFGLFFVVLAVVARLTVRPVQVFMMEFDHAGNDAGRSVSISLTCFSLPLLGVATMALANARLSGQKLVFCMMVSFSGGNCCLKLILIKLCPCTSSYFLNNKYPTGHHPDRVSDESDNVRPREGEIQATGGLSGGEGAAGEFILLAFFMQEKCSSLRRLV